MNQPSVSDTKYRPHEYAILSPSPLLRQAIGEDSNRVSDWEWYEHQLKDDTERRYCFERILYINPTHPAARAALHNLNNKPQKRLANQHVLGIIRLFRLWMRVGS